MNTLVIVLIAAVGKQLDSLGLGEAHEQRVDVLLDSSSCSSAAKVCAASTRRGSFRSVPTMMRLG